MSRHDGDDQRGLASICADELANLRSADPAEQLLHGEDECGTSGKTDDGPRDASVRALDDQARARAEHHAGSEGVRGSEQTISAEPPEGEWQRPEPGRQGGRGGREEDDQRLIHSGGPDMGAPLN